MNLPQDNASLPPAMPPTRQTSVLAVISLVCGILGFMTGVSSIAAIITGHMARSQIRSNPGMDGDGLAIAGLTMGYVVLAMGVIALGFVFLFLGGMVWLGTLGSH